MPADVNATPPVVLPARPVVMQASAVPEERPVKIAVDGLSFFYGSKQALQDITIQIRSNLVTAFIGPSGCGKSTFLRTLNRMNDVIPGARVEGRVTIGGRDVYGSDIDVVALRRQVGMVFQKSNPFPKSIFDNVASGLRIGRPTEQTSPREPAGNT